MITKKLCVKAIPKVRQTVTSEVVLCWLVAHTIHGRQTDSWGDSCLKGVGDKESFNRAGAVTCRTRLQCLTHNKMQHITEVSTKTRDTRDVE